MNELLARAQRTYFTALSLWVRPFIRNPSWIRLRAFGLAIHLQSYVLRWGIVFALQWLFAPSWLVSTRSGLQTLFQVVPSVVIALLVLVMGSLFAIAQMAISAYGSRCALLLIEDPKLDGLVARPLLLIVAALLLSGSVPDSGTPSAALEAGAATIALATLGLVAGAVTLLPARLASYSAPRSFTLHVTDSIDTQFQAGFTDPIVFRIPLLGEMLRACLRRGDSVGVSAALEALQRMQLAYLAALPGRPQLATHVLPDGTHREHWLVEDMRQAYVAAGEEALKIAAPEEDADHIAHYLTWTANAFIEAGQEEDARLAAESLIRLAVTSHQVSQATVNLYAAPSEGLARLEASAEKVGLRPLAAYCLAGWALAMSYPQYHFGAAQHPLWESGVATLGEDPPWEESRQLVSSQPWTHRFANKQYLGPPTILDTLLRAESEAASRGSVRA